MAILDCKKVCNPFELMTDMETLKSSRNVGECGLHSVNASCHPHTKRSCQEQAYAGMRHQSASPRRSGDMFLGMQQKLATHSRNRTRQAVSHPSLSVIICHHFSERVGSQFPCPSNFWLFETRALYGSVMVVSAPPPAELVEARIWQRRIGRIKALRIPMFNTKVIHQMERSKRLDVQDYWASEMMAGIDIKWSCYQWLQYTSIPLQTINHYKTMYCNLIQRQWHNAQWHNWSTLLDHCSHKRSIWSIGLSHRIWTCHHFSDVTVRSF